MFPRAWVGGWHRMESGIRPKPVLLRLPHPPSPGRLLRLQRESREDTAGHNAAPWARGCRPELRAGKCQCPDDAVGDRAHGRIRPRLHCAGSLERPAATSRIPSHLPTRARIQALSGSRRHQRGSRSLPLQPMERVLGAAPVSVLLPPNAQPSVKKARIPIGPDVVTLRQRDHERLCQAVGAFVSTPG